MGTYTELKVEIRLSKNTPIEVINLLERIVTNGDLGISNGIFNHEDVFVPEIKHEFFKCSRWYMLFNSTNWSNDKGSSFDKEKLLLKIHSEFKNYENEIDHFVDWISPYLSSRKLVKYLGWSKCEHTDLRTNIYKTHKNNV